HGTVERKPADRKRDRVCQDDSQRAADESNSESFRQELKQNVSAPRPECFLHPDLASALGHRDQHDVHQTDAADAEGKGADEAKQNLQADGDDFELVNLFHQIKHAHGTAVGLTELVLGGQDGACRLFESCVLWSFVVEPDGIEVVSVLQVTHGGERDVDGTINVIVALLHYRAEDADHFEAKAIDADALAQCVAPGE